MKKLTLLFTLILFVLSSCSDRFDSFTDSRDGQTYNTDKIGGQVWMAENLAYKPNDGNYWAYDNDDANVAVYGYLYDWETAMNACPEGWHLPSETEWSKLTNYLGEDVAGDKLKEPGSAHWENPLALAVYQTMFAALPGGLRYSNGDFGSIKYEGYWWTATEESETTVYGRIMFCNFHDVTSEVLYKEGGSSVRCVKD